MRRSATFPGRAITLAAGFGVLLGAMWLRFDGSTEQGPLLAIPAVEATTTLTDPAAPSVATPTSDVVPGEGDTREPARREVLPAPTARPQNSRFAAPEIGSLVGVLRDAAGGSPIAGAQIELERAESAGVLRRAETAADGSFRLHPLEVGKSYVVRARFSSLTGEAHRVDDLPAGESALDLTLDRANAWMIRFRDLDSGAPVAGVSVTIHAADERTSAGSSDLGSREGERSTSRVRRGGESSILGGSRSDRTGSCLVGGNALRSRDRVVLRTQRIDYAAVEIELSSREVPRGKEVEIPIGKLVSYSGIVVDLHGRPIVGASVSGRSQAQPTLGYPGPRGEVGLLGTGEESHAIEVPTKSDPSARTDVTDELGRFELAGMKRGSVASFVIGLDDGERFSIPFEDPDATRHRMPIEIRVPLEDSEIVGSIRLNGKPHPARISWIGATRSGFTDAHADGTYRLRTIESGVVTVNVIHSNGRTLASTTLDVPAHGSLRHDFDVTVSKKIHGVVRHGTGQSAADLRVDLRMHGAKADGAESESSVDAVDAVDALFVDSQFRPMFESAAKRSRFVATTRTDRDGRFQFEVSDVAASYFVIAIDRDGGLYCGTGDVFPGEQENAIVLQFLPKFRPARR